MNSSDIFLTVVSLGLTLGAFYILYRILVFPFIQASRDRKKMNALLHDISRPEADRRRDLVKELAVKGNVILNQDIGLVQYRIPKTPFSLLGFIILCFIMVLPGLLYLLWYATQKDKISSFVLDVEPAQ